MTSATSRSLHLSRRAALACGIGATLATAGPLSTTAHASVPATPATDVRGRLRDLERRHSARLGVFAHDTVTGRTVVHRDGERFPMCSVFKTLAVAAVLRDLDRNGGYLSTRVRYTEEDIAGAGYVPITGLPENLARGMTVAELCSAAISQSDNGAANLMLRRLGGPSAVTRFCRSTGDPVTRLDRWEPELNSAEPRRTTDTTSPRAIGTTYARLLLGNALDPEDGERLTGWLLANTTGEARLRAGLPAGWRTAEKTGSGDYGTTNDVGVTWPPGRGPIVMAVLATEPDAGADAPADEPLLAETAALLVPALI